MQIVTPSAIIAAVLVAMAPSFGQGTRPDSASMTAEIVKAGAVTLHGVAFVTGTSELEPQSGAVLGEVITLLAAHEEWRFEVQGHTDNAGAASWNLALSEARARVVVAWLTQHGVTASRLVARGYGDAKPIASNETGEGRATNRRIQLKKLNEE